MFQNCQKFSIFTAKPEQQSFYHLFIGPNKKVINERFSVFDFRLSTAVVFNYDFCAEGHGSIPTRGAMIHLASECTFVRVNPCHVVRV